MDLDFGFTGEEDFGLARSFSTQPLMQIAPLANFSNTTGAQGEETEKKVNMEEDPNEIRAEGFCFKMAPGQD